MVEQLVRRSIPSCFSGPVIEVGDGLVDLLPRDGAKIRLLGKELSKEAVGVFSDASLPGGIRTGEVGVGLKSVGDRFVLHKL